MTDKEILEDNNFWKKRYFELLDSFIPTPGLIEKDIEFCGILKFMEKTMPKRKCESRGCYVMMSISVADYKNNTGPRRCPAHTKRGYKSTVGKVKAAEEKEFQDDKMDEILKVPDDTKKKEKEEGIEVVGSDTEYRS